MVQNPALPLGCYNTAGKVSEVDVEFDVCLILSGYELFLWTSSPSAFGMGLCISSKDHILTVVNKVWMVAATALARRYVICVYSFIDEPGAQQWLNTKNK